MLNSCLAINNCKLTATFILRSLQPEQNTILRTRDWPFVGTCQVVCSPSPGLSFKKTGRSLCNYVVLCVEGHNYGYKSGPSSDLSPALWPFATSFDEEWVLAHSLARTGVEQLPFRVESLQSIGECQRHNIEKLFLMCVTALNQNGGHPPRYLIQQIAFTERILELFASAWCPC